MKIVTTWLVRAGVSAIALALVCILAGFFRKATPGDEGGWAFFLVVVAFMLAPAGMVMVSAAFVLTRGAERSASSLKNVVASVLLGVSIWAIVRAFQGSEANWWAIAAGAFVAAAGMTWLQVRATTGRDTPPDS